MNLFPSLEASRNARPWDELDPSSRLNAAFQLGREDLGWNVTLLATREQGDGGAPESMRSQDDPHEGDGLRTRRLLLGARLRTGAIGQTGFAALGRQSPSRSATLALKRLGGYALDLKLTQRWRDWSFWLGVLNAFSSRK